MAIKAFTLEFNGLASTISTDVAIGEAFDLAKQSQPLNKKVYKCIWDTGATHSVISYKVVNDLKLIPIGKTDVYIATNNGTGKEEKNVYIISLALPTGVGFPFLKVTDANLTGADVLIGMDIIIRGDFAITNHNGKTVCSFRMPSIERIDFLPNKKVTPYIAGRNALCPCGSGKKYKKCCWGKPQLISTPTNAS